MEFVCKKMFVVDTRKNKAKVYNKDAQQRYLRWFDWVYRQQEMDKINHNGHNDQEGWRKLFSFPLGTCPCVFIWDPKEGKGGIRW